MVLSWNRWLPGNQSWQINSLAHKPPFPIGKQTQNSDIPYFFIVNKSHAKTKTNNKLIMCT